MEREALVLTKGPASPSSTAVAAPAGSRHLSGLDDAGLMALLCTGSSAALREAYRRHAAHIRHVASRQCGHGHADDVLQEVFLALWRDPDRFDSTRGSLRTYLLTMARNRARDRFRSDMARRAREVADFAGRIELEANDTEHRVLERRAMADVQNRLRVLPRLEREAISLAYLRGLTYVEVATALGIPEGTAKGRIRSGLIRLRAHWGLADDAHPQQSA